MLLAAMLGLAALVVVRLALSVLHLVLTVVLWFAVAALVLVPLHVLPWPPFR